jgi:hydroxyacylglutathione hydrolase
MDMKVSSTIAYERAHNELLGLDDEDEFVKQTTSALAPQPPNFQVIVALNCGPLHAHRVDVEPLTPCQVQAQRQSGALLVDVRTDLQFDEAHIPGAVCNPVVRAGFGTKLAWVADRDQPAVFIGRDDTDAVHAAQLAASVGITNVVGYLAGGMTSWREEKRETASVERIDVPALHDRIDDVQLLDVREQAEWEEGHIPRAVHTPYHDIDRMPEGIDPAAPIAVICSSGQRSALAGSLLLRHGAKQVIHVADGGVGTWAEHGGPIEEPHTAGAER